MHISSISFFLHVRDPAHANLIVLMVVLGARARVHA